MVLGAVSIPVTLAAGCGLEDPDRPEVPEQTVWELALEPSSSLEEAQPVVGFVLTSARSAEYPRDLILIEGEVSNVSMGKYQAGEMTDALAERVVPSSFKLEPGRVTLRSLQRLAIGQRYSLLSRSGTMGSVVVNPNPEFPYLVRVWPPRDSPDPAMQVIYCGSSAPTESAEIDLFPTGTRATLEPGLDNYGSARGTCVRILPSAITGGTRMQPPAFHGGFAMEPTSWVPGAELPPVPELQCQPLEFPIGPGCLGFVGPQAVVRGPDAATFWVLRSVLGWHMRSVEAGERFSVALPEGAPQSPIDLWVYDLAGRYFETSVSVLAPPPAAQVVINEVMANPFGSEPAEEWIEIINAGTASAEMVGWRLRDESGEVELPPILIEPSGIALLARQDFTGGQAGDVPPEADCPVIRLPSLGKNGLTNAGEGLTLLDSAGTVVSRFPARSSGREGVSLARREPGVLDDSPEGFAPHAAPGASPGRANSVE